MHAFRGLLVLITATGISVSTMARGDVIPLFTEDLDAFNAFTDLGEGDLDGVEIIPAADSPFEDGDALRLFDFNPDDKPEIQGELEEPLFEPFRVDFQSINQSTDTSSKAIRFRMANSGKSVASESRVAFTLSWQADGRFTAKYDRGDGGVSTKGTFLPADLVSNITMVANPADSGTYSYTLFEEDRTLGPTSYDVFIDELLFTAEFENGMPFTLTKSEGEYDPELGLQRFGLFGSSNADVDPDYLFDNIILSTGPDIVGDPPANALQAGDADMDLDFDQLDLVKVQIVAKYLTGQAATWGEGDWNGAPGGQPGNPPVGNGQFDQLDIVSALAAGKYLAGPYAAIAPDGRLGDDQTSLVYDAGTGELSVDAPATVELTSINITSATAQFDARELAFNNEAAFNNYSSDNLFMVTFAGSFGSIRFGSVLPARIAEADLADDLTVVGSLAGGGDLGDVDLVYVPEPASAILLALSLVIGLSPRRTGTHLRSHWTASITT